jgi:hypothetical protein
MQKRFKVRLKAVLKTQKAAIKQFQEVLRDIRSSDPQPEPSKRLMEASRAVTECHDEIVALLLELNKSSVDGDGKKR